MRFVDCAQAPHNFVRFISFEGLIPFEDLRLSL